ncbi:MarR family winged helix-turn-helix transcriptional regulator [Homoserinimonas sp. OAct 916]|uniref:MarR family winged helix-turn-helix transcriptional regulator n=1 Tax=Homoserinimonas sp. OAct 916 TaxID=2211450 RepID=UPI000DBE4DD4|nr:MarR family transcriptional regulator [Homoserinimonas sp. OAct 916]
MPVSETSSFSDGDPRTRAGLSIELRSAVLLLARRIRQERSDEQITHSEYSVLAILQHYGPLTSGKLAEHEQVQPPSMTRTLGNLEKKGFVKRAEDPDDRRQVVVDLTPAGSTIVEDTRRRRDAWLARRLDALDSQQRATLADAAQILRVMITPQ